MAAKKKTAPTEASLRKRAASRGYTLVTEDGWYVELGGTRWGPMVTLDEVDDWLQKDA